MDRDRRYLGDIHDPFFLFYGSWIGDPYFCFTMTRKPPFFLNLRVRRVAVCLLICKKLIDLKLFLNFFLLQVNRVDLSEKVTVRSDVIILVNDRDAQLWLIFW